MEGHVYMCALCRATLDEQVGASDSQILISRVSVRPVTFMLPGAIPTTSDNVGATSFGP